MRFLLAPKPPPPALPFFFSRPKLLLKEDMWNWHTPSLSLRKHRLCASTKGSSGLSHVTFCPFSFHFRCCASTEGAVDAVACCHMPQNGYFRKGWERVSNPPPAGVPQRPQLPFNEPPALGLSAAPALPRVRVAPPPHPLTHRHPLTSPLLPCSGPSAISLGQMPHMFLRFIPVRHRTLLGALF